MGALTVADLVPGDAEPRIKDLVLAERLGFERPRVIRELVKRNMAELQRYGVISPYRAAKIGRGRPEVGYLLNEAQTLLICMLSETPRAADVREEVIKVYLSWRRRDGSAMPMPAAPRAAPDSVLERQAKLASAILAQGTISDEARQFALALPQMFAERRIQRMPSFWGNLDVRTLAVASHRQMTLDQALEMMRRVCEPGDVPSRKSIHRFWQKLDKVRRG